jgi:hypothetical protein
MPTCNLDNVYITQSKVAKIGKQKATLSSQIKRMSAMEYEMTNDITLPGRKPYKLAGQLNRNPRDFRLGAQIGKNYFEYSSKDFQL